MISRRFCLCIWNCLSRPKGTQTLILCDFSHTFLFATLWLPFGLHKHTGDKPYRTWKFNQLIWSNLINIGLRKITNMCKLQNNLNPCADLGGEGAGVQTPPPLKNHKALGFLCFSGQDPLKNHNFSYQASIKCWAMCKVNTSIYATHGFYME